jgi:hypothetical protein
MRMPRTGAEELDRRDLRAAALKNYGAAERGPPAQRETITPL